MEISALKAFVAVAEQKSFSLAAKKLFLTQPAISKRISSLEETLNVSLFDRSGRTVHLTEAGTTLLASATRILKELESASDQIKSLGHEVRGKLRIATSHHIGIHRLPTPLRRFTQEFPDVELDLQFMDSELAANEVQQGNVEIAVATLPLENVPGLSMMSIWDDQLVVVCERDHPLLRRSIVRAADLGFHPAVLPAFGTITRDIVNDFLGNEGISARIALETNYLETIRVMVSVGLGWSVLPASMLDENLRAVPVQGLAMQRTLGLIYRSNRSLGRAAKEFMLSLQNEAG